MAAYKENLSQTSRELPKKLPPIPKGQAVHRNLVASRTPSSHQSHRLYINTRTPFRSITTRVRKQLDKSLRTASSTHPQSMTNQLARKTLPLSARIQTIQNSQGSGIGLEHAKEVVVIGTGRTIEKVVNVAAFFHGQGDCDVRLKTASMGAVDELIGEEGDDGGGAGIGEMRERMVSCLEATIRLK